MTLTDSTDIEAQHEARKLRDADRMDYRRDWRADCLRAAGVRFDDWVRVRGKIINNGDEDEQSNF